MKMKSVIEAGRKASPLVREGFADLESRLKSFGQLLSDLASVKSESGREAMLAQCVIGLDGMSRAIADTADNWGRFDSILGDYKYNFKRRKKGPLPDLPGQQVMEFGEKNQ